MQELHLPHTAVSDLSPLVGMPLTELHLAGCKNITDIASLLEIPTLEVLTVPTTARNLELLRKMPKLKTLDFNTFKDSPRTVASTVADFWKKWDAMPWMRALHAAGIAYTTTEITEETPQGAKGTGMWTVKIGSKDFSDCSIFRGAANIQAMNLSGSAVTDLAPLADCKELKSLILPPYPKDIEFLRTFPKLERLSFREDSKTKQPAQTAAEFWKEYDSQGWLMALRASGVAIKSVQQLEDGTWDVNLEGAAITDLTILKGAPISRLSLKKTAVSELTPLRGMALKGLNLEGTKVTDLTLIQGMPLEELTLNRLPISDLTILRGLPLQKLEVNSTRVADLELLRGMALKQVAISDTKVTDLQPLKGMPLEYLHLGGTAVTDLSVLRGMPLTNVRLIGCQQLTDLSPLAEAKGLTLRTLPPNAKDIEFLRTFPKLERLSFAQAQPDTRLPAQTAAEFWKEWDEKKK